MAVTRTQAHELDDAAWRLLGALQRDARAPLKVLAEAAGLSVAATAERLKRLLDAGIAQGFTTQLDAAKAGYPVQATIGITVAQPAKSPCWTDCARPPRCWSATTWRALIRT